MSVEYKDFSGGITDNTTNGNRTQYEKAENLLVTRDKKLETRPGSEVLSSVVSYESIVRAVSERVGNIVNYRQDRYALIRKAADMFFQRVGNSVWQKVVGPNATQKAFWTGAADGIAQFKEAFGHIYGVMHNNPSDPAASDILTPMKFFADNEATEQVQVRNTYLKNYVDPYDSATWLATAITLANQIRSRIISHFAMTTRACTFDAATDRISGTNFGTLFSDSETNDQNLIWFASVPGGSGISTLQGYFLINRVGDTYQLVQDLGGAAINITASGAATVGYHTTAQSTAGIAAVATDYDTLLTLTKSLVTFFNLHIKDALKAVGVTYHRPPAIIPFQPTGVGNFYVKDQVFDNFSDVALALNDLKFKFNCHLLAGTYDTPALKMHGPVIAASNELVTADYIFKQDSLAPDLSNSSGSEATSRWYYTFPDILSAQFVYTLAGFNYHLTDSANHVDQLVKYNNVKNSTAVAAGDGTRDAQRFVQIFQMAYSFTLHRADTYYNEHGGTESATTSIATLLAGVYILAGDMYGDLTSAAGYTLLQAFMKTLLDKLVLHALQGAAIHTAATTPQTLLGGAGQYQAIITSTYASLIYAFDYVLRYKIKGALTFEEESSPVFVPATRETYLINGAYDNATGAYTAGVASGINPTIPFAFITGLVGLSGENYDAANADIKIFRTLLNGTAFFQVAEIAGSGASTYDDVVITDAHLEENPQLYTNGGVVGNDPAPRAKAFTIVNNKGYYGGIIETTVYGDTFLPKRLRQSKDSAPGEAPEDFFVDLEEDIQTIGRAGEYPVVICTKGCYRIEGEFDELGRGGMIAKLFADRVGGVSVNGGVTVNDIFYFAGIDGVYASNAFEAKLITPHLKATYTKYVLGTRKHYIQADFDKLNNRIVWTVRKTAGGTETDLDTCMILDLRNGTVEEACITEINGTSFSSTAIAHISSQLVRGDKQGFAFKHVDTDYSDPAITRTGSGAISGTEAIIPLWRSIAEGFDQSTERKWAVLAFFTFKRLTTNLSAQFRSIIDQTESKVKNMKHLLHRSTSYASGYSGSDFISARRTIPAGHFRSFYRQVEIALGKGATSSSTTNFASVTGTSVVLTTGTFAADANGKYTAFSGDFYNEEYLIVSGQGTNTLFLASAPGNSVSQGWAIRDYPKDERMRIDAVSLDASDAGRTLRPSVADGTTS